MLSRFLKKKNELLDQPNNLFPTASELLTRTTTRWKILSDEEVLSKLESKSKDGERKVIFTSVIIQDATIERLEQKEYQVYVSKLDGVPFYTISW